MAWEVEPVVLDQSACDMWVSVSTERTDLGNVTGEQNWAVSCQDDYAPLLESSRGSVEIFILK